ncbi:MAG: U32 family peptidase [Gammaproteobacteria bacterium]|nr:MAG: U32 family peptidase [Gammaproteobacteria bacterium]
MKKIELLSPAGMVKNMEYALAFGADAVYAGMPRYSLRVRNNEFLLPQIKDGIKYAHKLNKKFYLTSNILPHQTKIKTFLSDIEPIISYQPDAVIVADPGLIMMMRETYPDINLHLSVQANTINSAAVKFWHKQGIKRIILSRELSIDEIKEIRDDNPDIELEVFIHGALCIAYSGRCLLSGYFNHRDPNQGTCTNSCRWDYKLKNSDNNKSTNNPNSYTTQEYLLEEQKRQQEYMPITEDEHGTYIMNSKDLRGIEYVADLIKIGIDSLKIEGRTKSYYYTARTTAIYKEAIDDAIAGRDFNQNLKEKLNNLSNRGYTAGFFDRFAPENLQSYEDNRSISFAQQFIGEVIGYDNITDLYLIDVKNRFSVGDKIEVINPKNNHIIIIDKILNEKNKKIKTAPGSGYIVKLNLPITIPNKTLLARFL